MRAIHAARRDPGGTGRGDGLATLGGPRPAACCGARTNDHPTSDTGRARAAAGRGRDPAGSRVGRPVPADLHHRGRGVHPRRGPRPVRDAAVPPQGRPTRSCPAQTHGNNLLEVVWTAIPFVVVMVLFVVSLDACCRRSTRPRADARGHRGRHRLPVAVDVRVPGPGPELHGRRQARARRWSCPMNETDPHPAARARTSSTPSTCPPSSTRRTWSPVGPTSSRSSWRRQAPTAASAPSSAASPTRTCTSRSAPSSARDVRRVGQR